MRLGSLPSPPGKTLSVQPPIFARCGGGMATSRARRRGGRSATVGGRVDPWGRRSARVVDPPESPNAMLPRRARQ
jgi:hypothetical protein